MPIVQETQFLKDIITGWNEKLTFNNVELSNLSPFVQLYTLYDTNTGTRQNNNDPTRVRNQRPIVEVLQDTRGQDIVNIRVLEPNGDETFVQEYVGVEIAKLESQVASNNLKGGAGIQSLRVNRGTREAFTSKFDIDLVVTDVDLIKEKIEYSSLNTLNQDFLIIYGWTSGRPGQFMKPPSPENGRMDVHLNRSNNGYWMASLVSLQKFNFSLGQENHLIVKLNFLSSRISRLAFRRTKDFARNVLRDLQTPNFGSSVNPDRARVIYDTIRTDKGHSTTDQQHIGTATIYIVSSGAGLRSTFTRLQLLRSIARRTDDEGGRSKNEQGVVPEGRSFSEQIARPRVASHRANLVRKRRSAIQNNDQFVTEIENYINDISIELKRLNFYLGVTDAEAGFGNRQDELASQRLNRTALMDAYVTNVILDLDSIVYQPTVISLSEFRTIISGQAITSDSTKEERIIANAQYGSIFGATIRNNQTFIANNPSYNTNYYRRPEELPPPAPFPTSSVITINMNSKRIVKDPPQPEEDTVEDSPGLIDNIITTFSDSFNSRQEKLTGGNTDGGNTDGGNTE